MNRKAEIIGLRLTCPTLGRTVNVPREDYAIGPKDLWPHNYVIRCKCGAIHKVKMKTTNKPKK